MACGDQITGNTGLPIVSVSINGGAEYLPIAELVTPGLPQPSADSYETTSTDNVDGYRTFVQGWIDAGEAVWEFNGNDATRTQLKALSGCLQWKVEWKDPNFSVTDPGIELDGFLTTLPEYQMEMEDRWIIPVTVKITGKPVDIPGTDA